MQQAMFFVGIPKPMTVKALRAVLNQFIPDQYDLVVWGRYVFVENIPYKADVEKLRLAINDAGGIVWLTTEPSSDGWHEIKHEQNGGQKLFEQTVIELDNFRRAKRHRAKMIAHQKKNKK